MTNTLLRTLMQIFIDENRHKIYFLNEICPFIIYLALNKETNVKLKYGTQIELAKSILIKMRLKKDENTKYENFLTDFCYI